MKIYLAGKITGDRDYRAKFAAAAEKITAQGHIVLNPAELPEGMQQQDYMRICIAMMDCAEAVAFLPDWAESRGARAERALSEYNGKPCFDLRN